jgi:hypothetical protein
MVILQLGRARQVHQAIRLAGTMMLASCASRAPNSPRPLFPRAIVTKEDVDSAVVIEKRFAVRYDSVAPSGTAWFQVREDTGVVLLVAPHATSQLREGAAKPADGGSGSLAEMMSRATGSSVIYTVYQSPSDPNYYDDNEFKVALRALVLKAKPVLVLDLHASHWRRPYDVDFGTMGGQSLLGHEAYLRNLGSYFRAEGLDNLSQDYFAAAKNHTVTKFVAGLGVPCIQLEINSAWLLGDGTDISQEHRFAQTLEALIRFVQNVQALKRVAA